MPDARTFGPDCAICIAKSGGITPTPTVRERQIGFCPIRSSYSPIRPRMYEMNWRAFGSKPCGMSSATPPTWL